MNKQEWIQTIQTIRKRTKPARILSAVVTGGAFLAAHFFDQSIWSILVLICALAVSGMMLGRESFEISRLSDSTRAKRLIRLRSIMGFGIISLMLLLTSLLNLEMIRTCHCFTWQASCCLELSSKPSLITVSVEPIRNSR